MKKKDFLQELRSLNIEELKRRRGEMKFQMLNLRMKLKEGLAKNPLMLRTMRRNIAIINTVLREKGCKID